MANIDYTIYMYEGNLYSDEKHTQAIVDAEITNRLYWDHDNNVWVMNNLVVSTTAGKALQIDGSGTVITVSGTNSLTSGDGTGATTFYTNQDITLQGNGTLNITCNSCTDYSNCMYVNGACLVVDGITLNCIGDEDNGSSIGLTGATTTITSGTLTAVGAYMGLWSMYTQVAPTGTLVAKMYGPEGDAAYRGYPSDDTPITVDGSTPATVYDADGTELIWADGIYKYQNKAHTLCVTTSAGGTPTFNYTIYVYNGGLWEDADHTQAVGDSTVTDHFTFNGGTWTMSGLNFDTTSMYGFQFDTDAVITVDGTNSITVGNGTDMSAGVFFDGHSIVLRGDGSLSVTARDTTGAASVAFGTNMSGALTIDGITLNAVSGNAAASSIAIAMTDQLMIQSGTVHAAGGTAQYVSAGVALTNGGAIVSDDATLIAEGPVAYSAPSAITTDGSTSATIYDANGSELEWNPAGSTYLSGGTTATYVSNQPPASSYTLSFSPSSVNLTVGDSTYVDVMVTDPDEQYYQVDHFVFGSSEIASFYQGFGYFQVNALAAGSENVSVSAVLVNGGTATASLPVTVTSSVYSLNSDTSIPGGGVNFTVGGQSASSASAGSTVTVSAKSVTGYTFSNYTSAQVTVSGNSFTMPSQDVTVRANYTAIDYTLTGASSVAGGEVTFTVGGKAATTAHINDVVTVSAAEVTGYTFNNFTSDQVSISGNSFTMPASNVTVQANYTAIDYTLTSASSVAGGGVTFTVSGVQASTAHINDVVTLTAVEVAGYTFKNFASDDVTITDNQFTMPASNVTVTAVYEADLTPGAFYCSTWTDGEEINVTWHGMQYSGTVGDNTFFNNYSGAKSKVSGTDDPIVVLESKTITSVQHYDSQNVYLTCDNAVFKRMILGGNVVSGSHSYSGDYTVNIEGGTYLKEVAGADASNKYVDRTGNVTLNISGGVFVGHVLGGGYYSNNALGCYQLEGDTHLTISGGTFNTRVYAGCGSYTEETSALVAMEGDTYLTIDASSGPIKFNEHVAAGNRGNGLVIGSTNVTVTGQGSNLTFGKTSVLFGGCGGDYYENTSSGRVARTSVIDPETWEDAGVRALTFDGFTGDFGAEIRMFSDITFENSTNMNFADTALDLKEVENWNFDCTSCATNLNKNLFKGDTINVDTTGLATSWTLLSGAEAAFADLGSASSVTLGDEAATYTGTAWTSANYSLALDDKQTSLVISKIA